MTSLSKHLKRLDQVQAKELCGYCCLVWVGLAESIEHREKGMRTLLFQSLARGLLEPVISGRDQKKCGNWFNQTLDTVSIFLGRCSFSAHPWDYAEVGTRGILSLQRPQEQIGKVRVLLVKEAFGAASLVVSNQLLLLILLPMFSCTIPYRCFTSQMGSFHLWTSGLKKAKWADDQLRICFH